MNQNLPAIANASPTHVEPNLPQNAAEFTLSDFNLYIAASTVNEELSATIIADGSTPTADITDFTGDLTYFAARWPELFMIPIEKLFPAAKEVAATDLRNQFEKLLKITSLPEELRAEITRFLAEIDRYDNPGPRREAERLEGTPATTEVLFSDPPVSNSMDKDTRENYHKLIQGILLRSGETYAKTFLKVWEALRLEEWQSDFASYRRDSESFVSKSLDADYSTALSRSQSILDSVKKCIANRLSAPFNKYLKSLEHEPVQRRKELASQLNKDLSALGLAIANPDDGSPSKVMITVGRDERYTCFRLQGDRNERGERPSWASKTLVGKAELALVPDAPRKEAHWRKSLEIKR